MQIQILGSKSQGGLLIGPGEQLKIQAELQYPETFALPSRPFPAEPHFVKLISQCPYLIVTDTHSDGTFDVWNPTQDEVVFEWYAHHLHSDAQDPLHEVADQGTPILAPQYLCQPAGISNPLAVHSRWIDPPADPPELIPSAPGWYSPPWTIIEANKDEAPPDNYVEWNVDGIPQRFRFNRSGLYKLEYSCMVTSDVEFDYVIMWLLQDPASAQNTVNPFYDFRELNAPITGIVTTKLLSHGIIAIDQADPDAERTFEVSLVSGEGFPIFGDALLILGGTIDIVRVAANPLAP